MARTADPQENYQTQSDADTLQKAQEIQADNGRHKKALGHLQDRQSNTDAAVAHAKKHFVRKTKQRMQKAFGQDSGGKTPFEAAAGGDNADV